MRLTIWRLWVRIQAPYTGWTFFTYICLKIVMFLCWKDENKQKRRRGWPFFNTTRYQVAPQSIRRFHFVAWKTWIVADFYFALWWQEISHVSARRGSQRDRYWCPLSKKSILKNYPLTMFSYYSASLVLCCTLLPLCVPSLSLSLSLSRTY